LTKCLAGKGSEGRPRFVLAALFLAMAGCSVAPDVTISGPPLVAVADFQKGIAFTGYSADSYVGENARLSLQALRQTGAGWISLLATAYQDTINATLIDYQGRDTPTDASILDIMSYAHGLGLKVVLKPHVDLLNDPDHYRGDIGPGFAEADWAEWFASYRDFILHYAGLATAAGAELFCVGCELGTTVSHETEWRAMIAEIRGVYSGPLVYADNLVETRPNAVGWWDAVDFIGEDAYPTLSQSDEPTLDELTGAWRTYAGKLRVLASKWNKSLIITEVGFRSVRGGEANPWDWQRTGPVDLAIQEKCYEATFRAIDNQSWLAGIYWWQWAPDPNDGGPDDTGYTPHGKPAESVLRTWFGVAAGS